MLHELQHRCKLLAPVPPGADPIEQRREWTVKDRDHKPKAHKPFERGHAMPGAPAARERKRWNNQEQQDKTSLHASTL
jgi:hypothetical protein